MSKLAALVGLGLLVFVSTTRAEPLATAGIGLASCEKLAPDILPEQGFNHLPNALLYYWVQGYMSAANIALLEGDSEHLDLSKYDGDRILSAVKEFCVKNPSKKPISLIDELLNDGEKIEAQWKKGSVKWAAD
ncbi:MAG TPA: hypothetical protein VM434_09030 [Beijerinckiaceae bacterium]|nr:hypothetical protein [Beijerinckiaceae bacterium]